MGAAVLLTTFFVLVICNVPIAACLGISSFVTLWVSGMSMNMIAINYFTAGNKFVLLAIPFFILAGNIMEKAQISTKLISFAQSLVGHVRGGLAIVCVAVSCFFAAISGSGPATVAALGMIIIPAMIHSGYKPASASALMATGGAIGSIIPPSITFVLYGSITGVSIGKLFMAGVIPGLLVGLFLVIAMTIISRKVDLKKLPKASTKERLASFKDAIWGLLMPVIILGGIYGGIFTPTESAAVAAVYGLFVGVFIYRTVKVKELFSIFVDSSRTTAQVMFITANASLFAWVITIQGIAAATSDALISMAAGNVYVFLLIVNVILLIAGCLIDGTSCFFILTPILFPAAMRLGIDPIAFGVVMVVNVAIGQVTPPVGLNLYVACGLGNVSLKEISYSVIPFVGAAFLAALLVTYIPEISLFLPRLLS